MCGIGGIVGDVRRDRIAAMVRAMHHRGPDDSGVMIDEGVAFGVTRLAILDLSSAGHQPMWNPDRSICIAYNGELYNFHEQRRLLESRGHAFSSHSDTEVVLRMYEAYGDDFLSRMRGMFALAIFDRRRPGCERTLLARDQFGIKPLLYARIPGGVVFASEMKALLASRLVNAQPDPAVLPFLLVKGSIPQPMTMLRDVQMLMPAHRLIVEQGELRSERYWQFAIGRHPELQQAEYPELVSVVRSNLEAVTRLQMISDVPVGAFLSGGVDSSTLVALMARLSAHRVKTFSVGYSGEGAVIDETADAARVAQFIGTDHTRVEITGDMVRDRIGHIAAALDQPTVDGVNAYFVSWAARQSVTVAISGTGGDELFAGYPWFTNTYTAAQRGETDVAMRYAHEYLIYNLPDALALLPGHLRAAFDAGRFVEAAVRWPDALPNATVIDRVTALCLRGYTQNQLLRDIDAVSMSQSLEVRVPFLDTVMADVALSLPTWAKLDPSAAGLNPYAATYRQLGVKRILIDIGKTLLPPDMDNQPKRGFGMPFDAWLVGPLREVLHDTLSPSTVAARGLFDPKTVTGLMGEYASRRRTWPHVWVPMMTELWCREVLDCSAAIDHQASGPETEVPVQTG
jgi:asparagine synthase (glutamine-hydrolysing)